MRYEQTKKLSNRQFKRLVGVERRTFDEMVKVLQQVASTASPIGDATRTRNSLIRSFKKLEIQGFWLL